MSKNLAVCNHCPGKNDGSSCAGCPLTASSFTINHEPNRTITMILDKKEYRLPTIKKVIFNPPATIVMWSDNTKTVVKADKEAFDPEKGLAMAISKKALGNKGNYFNEIKKWVEKYDIKSDYPEVTIARLKVDVSASLSDNFKKLKESVQKMGHSARDLRVHTKRWLAYQRLCNAIGDKKATKADLIAAMHEAADYLEDNTDE